MKPLIGWPPTWSTLLLLPALLVGFTVHELAHAVVAYVLGDTSQVERRRLTFNPLRHVSWPGLLVFLLVGFGWARPVWVDYTRLRIKNRPLGMFLVAVAGAVSNLIFALLALGGMMATVIAAQTFGNTTIRDVLEFLSVANPGLTPHGLAIALSSYVFSVNLILAVFNLLPIPPLDGFAALISLFTVVRNALRKTGPGAAPVPRPGPVPADAGAPSPAEIHFAIARDYHCRGLLDEALVRYRQAIDHDSQFALAFYNLGLVYIAKGRLGLATAAFRSAAQHSLDPGVRGQAELRLRELAQVGQALAEPFGPLPMPLDLNTPVDAPAGGPPPLDPTVARHIWLRLGVGGAVFAILSVLVWLFVTAVTLIELAA